MDESSSGNDFGTTPFGVNSGTGGTTGPAGTTASGMTGGQSAMDTERCPHCGQSMAGGGLEKFLGRLGINEEMISNLKSQMGNVDIDEYLNTARDYLKNSGTKANAFARENPGKIAAGVAALALGAGLIYAAKNRDRETL